MILYKTLKLSFTLGGALMFNFIYYEFKNWWFGESIDPMEEFELLESQHTRVHHDVDIYEVIRIH
jgi:hypothetical protein